ncbi:hypothetical protein RJB75_06370, partial [Staphylococcus hominis]|uniref:hypothetical protein n=1 Tax=Staphylococcus hominis TaxID=1290 RepID=UPI0028796D9F
KVTAQRAENNQKNYKKDNFYIISIEIVFFHLSRYFMSRTLTVILVDHFIICLVTKRNTL